MKFYFVETSAYNMVAVADKCGKCFIVHDGDTDSGLGTLADAINENYDALYGCKSAIECAYAVGTDNAMSNIYKFAEIIEECAESYTEFVPKGISRKTFDQCGPKLTRARVDDEPEL